MAALRMTQREIDTHILFLNRKFSKKEQLWSRTKTSNNSKFLVVFNTVKELNVSHVAMTCDIYVLISL